MTISSTSNRISYDGTGALTPLAVSFPFFSQSDLVVVETIIATGVQSTLAITTNYTITGTPDALGHYSNGGTVTPVLAFPVTVRWSIYNDPPRTQQEIDLVENDSLPAESVEAAFDYVTLLAQRNHDLISRSLRQPDGDESTIATLPSSVDRSSMFLGFDADGDPIASAGTSANLGPVSSFINTLLDDADAATARATLGITTTSNNDDAFRVKNVSDPTKELAFDLHVISPSTTRTIVIPNSNGAMALIPTTHLYTGTDTLDDNVGLAFLSGASFTLTLPPIASSVSPVTFRHGGTSLTQVYTIKGNSTDSIVGLDSTANTFLLYTNGEAVTLWPDGTAWYVTQHRAETNWTDAGVITITATTSNPTKPTTPDIDKVYWRRQGNRVFLRYILQVSSAAGSAAGTGNYLFALPTNITMDTTIMTPVGTALTAALRSEASASYLDGKGIAQVDSVGMSSCIFFAYDTTHFQAWRDRDGSDAPLGSASAALNNAELSYNFELNMRAANWRL